MEWRGDRQRKLSPSVFFLCSPQLCLLVQGIGLMHIQTLLAIAAATSAVAAAAAAAATTEKMSLSLLSSFVMSAAAVVAAAVAAAAPLRRLGCLFHP